MSDDPSSPGSSPRPPPLYDPSILLQFSFKHICLFALFPPLISILGVLPIGYWLHRNELFDYLWLCRVVRLPSVSRVLNLPAERILWNFAVALHLPLRPLITLHYFRLCSPFGPLRVLFFVTSLADNIFLLGLSFVGEREDPLLHVCCFCAFLCLCFVHFVLHSLLFCRSPLRVLSLLALCFLVPLLTVSFSVHQLFCAGYSYELFVIGEYLTIASMFAFNCAILIEDSLKNESADGLAAPAATTSDVGCF
uniref:CWH43-like N-terminal domain-containing protein n=1 Tax=Globodera rostochiensis TaxID=31243 RepID=A0A914HH61_GLORO